MNNNFDELTKGLAQSVTRRQALERFSAGLASVIFAWLGLVNNARAGALPSRSGCTNNKDCASGVCRCVRYKIPCAPGSKEFCGHYTICQCL